MRLTAAGETLRRHAVAALERLDRAGEEPAGIHRGSGGRLRVGAFASSHAVLPRRAALPTATALLGHLREAAALAGQ
ncbi:hypothetical protein [Spongiactinospora sp. TRM90649]|uniref:hypothetical protein n=1 Tax=Spongiactinospora sp. TRM90649 TaxID=3031114 RepID=UPI0023F86F10|nr:hypothetical protein [Spongiactinospora sp. TRM90649]MDF5758356.1 hypothetical protein [Spongiactinospora sp. TRM90649]